jgi:hypothetical protein
MRDNRRGGEEVAVSETNTGVQLRVNYNLDAYFTDLHSSMDDDSLDAGAHKAVGVESFASHLENDGREHLYEMGSVREAHEAAARVSDFLLGEGVNHTVEVTVDAATVVRAFASERAAALEALDA